MLYIKEFDIDDFAFWGGAKDRMNDATDEQRALIAERLEEFGNDPEYTPTEAEVNGFVWFECNDIFCLDEN